MKPSRFVALVSTLLACVSPALAGMRVTYAGEGQANPLVIEVADNGDARIGEDGSEDYGLLIGGRFYVVGREGTGWTVAAIVDVAAAIDASLRPIFGDALTRTDTPTPAVALRFTADGDRTIAGRRGTVYHVAGLDHANPAAKVDYVLSDDPALRPAGAALEQFMHASLLPSAPLLGGAVPERIEETRALFARGVPLDAGGRFQLTGAETATIDPARLAFPAPPKTREALTATMRQMVAAARESEQQGGEQRPH